jgi:hypothetical protein
MTAVKDMTPEELIAAHDELTENLVTDLDALHVDLCNLQVIKDAVNALGVDEPGKAIVRGTEEDVIVPMLQIATLHNHLETIRAQLAGVIGARGGSVPEALAAYTWETEYQSRTTITREA